MLIDLDKLLSSLPVAEEDAGPVLRFPVAWLPARRGKSAFLSVTSDSISFRSMF